MDTCKKLSSVISALLQHREFSSVTPEKLQEMFFENLSEVFQLAFDVNVDIRKLKEFSKNKKNLTDFEQVGQFLFETLSNKKTYLILNYYMYIFIQSYLNSAYQNALDKINEIMLKQGLSENEVEQVKKDYWDFVSQQNVLQKINSALSP